VPIELDAIGEEDRGGPCVRVMTFVGDPEAVERGLQVITDHVLPAMRGQPGWGGMLGLSSPDKRRGLVLSFWESESALLESNLRAGDFRSRAAQLGISVSDVQRLEIVFHELP